MRRIYRANTKPVAGKYTFIKPGDDVVSGIRAIEAYGHTPGHLAFMIESGGKSILFWGDCAHHQVASLAHPEWHCVFDTDKEQGVATRRRIFDMAATDRLPVIGYHMPFPSLGLCGDDRARQLSLACPHLSAQPLTQAERLFRQMRHGLDVVSVGVDDEAAVIVGVIMRPEPRRSVVLAAGCNRRIVERLHFLPGSARQTPRAAGPSAPCRFRSRTADARARSPRSRRRPLPRTSFP